MNYIKKYLEKRKQKKEQRKQEEFLNTRVPLNELVNCAMYRCFDVKYVGETLWEMGKYKQAKFDSIKILREIKGENGYHYIDPTTGKKYKKFSHYSVEVDDVVVGKTMEIEFSKEVLKKQYITIAELIELNTIKPKINLV